MNSQGRVLTPWEPEWDEFVDRLLGPEGINFRGDRPETAEWKCWCDHTFSALILAKMGFDADETISFFHEYGAHCDCTVLLSANVLRERVAQYLFPLIEHGVQTPEGPGKLVQVFADRCTVVFNSDPPRLAFFRPDQIGAVA